MKAPGFFRFAGYDPPADGRPFNGLLAFLPHPESRQLPQGVLQHVAFEGNGFQWLEIKGRIMPEKLHIELTADSPRYWLLFQLAGSSEVYLPHAIRIADGGCFGFGSRFSTGERVVHEIKAPANHNRHGIFGVAFFVVSNISKSKNEPTVGSS